MGDCFVFVAMSHGGPDAIYGTDGKPVSISHDIINQFDGKNWPKMEGKPKIFLIQACRGQCKYKLSNGVIGAKTCPLLLINQIPS